MFNNFKAVALIAASALVSGCASVAVSNDAIEKNTAHALGIPVGSFSISNRVDEGIKSSYNVKTGVGKTYSCYVTGTVSVMGRMVSDAMCNEMTAGKQKPAAATTAVPPSGQTCNALLKAAGLCG